MHPLGRPDMAPVASAAVARRTPRQSAYPTELLANLTLRELRGKFKRSTLGWLWSIINPAANIAVYSIVFGVFLAVEAPEGDPSGLHVYALFLMCGLIPWTFLANGLTGSVESIVSNEGLVKKVYFPRWVLPASSVLAWMASYGVELIVLGVILLVAGNMVLPWLPVVLVLMLLQLGFTLGIGMVLSGANAYFRDIQHFLGIFLNIWFYATPILYPPDLPPESKELLGVTLPVRDILSVNPMAKFVEAYRDALYHLRLPGAGTMAYLILLTAVTLTVGVTVFNKLEASLAEEL